MLQINLVGVMQKEVGNISEESTQDKYIYTRTHYIYTHEYKKHYKPVIAPINLTTVLNLTCCKYLH